MIKSRSFLLPLPLLCLLALHLLPSQNLAAQNVIRQLNGMDLFSTAGVTAAEGQLTGATSNPDGYDVRFSFVTNYVTVTDRYQTYDANTIPDFALIPYPGGLTPATTAQQNQAIETAFQHAEITLTGQTPNTIHVMYAVAVSLNADGSEAIRLHKYVHVGAGVGIRERMIAENITPTPELDPRWGTPTADPWLLTYSTRLITALNDPNYVVTGSALYAGEVYYPGDTLYYFHEPATPNTVVAGTIPGAEQVVLQVNTQDNVTGVGWTAGTNAGTRSLLGPGAGATAGLRVHESHFAGTSGLVATYGGRTGDYYFRPVNLIIALDQAGPIEKRANVGPTTAWLTNNGLPFGDLGPLELEIRVRGDASVNQNNYATKENRRFTGTQDPRLAYAWGNDICFKADFVGKVFWDGTLQLQRTIDIPVKCSYDIPELRVTAYDTSGNLLLRRMAIGSDTESDTLFVVSPEAEVTFTASVAGGVTGVGSVRATNTLDPTHPPEIEVYNYYPGYTPQADDFWGVQSSDPEVSGVEPYYNFGPPANIQDLHPRNYHRVPPAEVTYKPVVWPGDWNYDPALDQVPTTVYQINSGAFESYNELYVAFVRRKKFEQTITYASVQDVVANANQLNDAGNFMKAATSLIVVKNTLSSVIAAFDSQASSNTDLANDIAAFDAEVTTKITYDQEEDPNSHHFFHTREREHKLTLKGDIKFEPGTPPLKVDFRNVARYGPKITITPFGSYFEKINARHPEYSSNYAKQSHTSGGSIGVDFEVKMEASLDSVTFPNLRLIGSVGVKAGVELEFQSTTPINGPSNTALTLKFPALQATGRLQMVYRNNGSANPYTWTLLDVNVTYNITNPVDYPIYP